jgi:hypothetical protein
MQRDALAHALAVLRSKRTDTVFLPCGALRIARLNEVGPMNKVTFPNACQLMRWHFHPVGFEANMDAPSSMVARLFDRASGETVIAIAGIPCQTVMNAMDVERIIEAIELELETFTPQQTLYLNQA